MSELSVEPAVSVAAPRIGDTDRVTRVARWSVSAVFFLTGAGTANWAVRIPALQEALGLSDGRLGFALLGVSAGAVAAMPIAGRVVARRGSRPVTLAAAVVFGLALMLPPAAPNFAALLLAFIAVGLANGVLDVAMNAQAATVQTRFAQPIMGRVHAFYSLGGLVGAVIGGRIASAGIGVQPHLAGVGLAIGIGAWTMGAGMLPPHTDAVADRAPVVGELRALRALGVLAFCVLFGEGAMMNWSAVYLHNVSATGPALAAAGFAAFSLMMTAGRAVGDSLTTRLGHARLTRLGGTVAAFGVALTLTFPQPVPVILGFGAVGAGLSIIFPIVLAASARTPRVAPSTAIAVVSMCGYAGLLAGPPLIGVVANAVTLRGGLALVAVTSLAIVGLAYAVTPRSVPNVSGTPGAERPSGHAPDTQTAA